MFIEDYIYDLPIPQLEMKSHGWNGRCPICGDSKKSDYKKRFWIKPESNGTGYFVQCYNCGYNSPFIYFLKEHFNDVYKRYMKELFKGKNKKTPKPQLKVEEKPREIKTIKPTLLKVHKFPDDHIAHQFFEERKIPKIWKRYLFYTDNFKVWINEQFPETFEYVPESDPRIVIPFYTIDGKMFACAGRALGNNKGRYLTIKFDDRHPKIFGLERTNFNKIVYVFEGQIDSLFIPNSIAMAGSISGLTKLYDYAQIDRYVLVADIEPRNKDVVKFIQVALRKGFKVAMLPLHLKKYGKDINDLVKNSPLTNREIFDIINENVFDGLTGLMKFNTWKRIKI